MKWISSLAWTGFPITVMYFISALGLTGVQSQEIECYTCTDQGEGGCLPENAANVTCPSDCNVCVEAIIAIKTSHDTHIILKKGCGFGDSMLLDKSILFYGISIFFQLNQCNSSLCNTDMDLEDYQLAPDDNITHVPSRKQCYSCIEKTGVDCTPSSALVETCYNDYTHCFDGNVTVSIENDTTVIPIKSCSMRYRCAMQTQTYGSATFEIRGACCTKNFCNKDLSNRTQIGEMPYLLVLNEDNDEVVEIEALPPWINPTTTQAASTGGTRRRDGGVGPPVPNSTTPSVTSYATNTSAATNTIYTPYGSYASTQTYSGQPLNVAPSLTYSPWVIIIVVLLS
ncbi:ly6/PLAUR domain-containing protein 3-like [Pseudophryne corroboree]|uniref:ly6/PLAUR domain-containing protein 3-like n=1 Tax=Pseudophryne corroboree TaxID=495146 RepID=UPI0030814953